MIEMVKSEIHDAKLKCVHAINNSDMVLAEKYQKIIKDLEGMLKTYENQQNK